jgi:hypothetical protein
VPERSPARYAILLSNLDRVVAVTDY